MRPAKQANAFFIETADDLELLKTQFKSGGTMFRDIESTSGNPNFDALNTYLGARVVGYAISWRDPDGFQHPTYYVSTRHRDAWASNIPLDINAQFVAWCNANASRWVNHNVKFDAHFLAMECAEQQVDTGEFFFTGEWYCTVVAAKLLDSDRLNFELKQLAEDWLGIKPDLRDEIRMYLRAKKSKDYGDVPSTMLGEYAINDVNINVKLYDYCEQKLDSSLAQIHSIEKRLTPVLFDMEREGVKVDTTALRIKKIQVIERLFELEAELRELTGYEFSNGTKHLKHIILELFGLPVVAFSERVKVVNGKKMKVRGGPSFDADALALYRALPEVVNDPHKSRFFEVLLEWRDRSTFLSLYLNGWEPFIDSNGYLHANYNQIIRTGRMSCSAPNLTQLNLEAKSLIVCEDGEEICSNDASQIEFRLIAHYMGFVGDTAAIDAYNRDPNTDYHSWAATLCEIPRTPAKNINFMKAYGGGKAKLIQMLRGQQAVIDAVKTQLDDMISRKIIEESQRVSMYNAIMEQRAASIIATYEERLPGLRKVSDLATAACKANGYVKNAYGRRRQLPSGIAHIAFNTVVQGGAMDFIKTRMIASSPRHNETIRDAGIKLVLNVHDEIVHKGPTGTFSPGVVGWLEELLSTQDPVQFKVPLLWKGGVSSKSWAEASH